MTDSDELYIVAPVSTSSIGLYERVLNLTRLHSIPPSTGGDPQSQQDETKLNDYYTKTSILNKMVEICNTPSDPHPTSSSNTNPINPSKNTGLLQEFFDHNNTDNDFNTLTNKGKYFSNIPKDNIECVKLGDIYGDDEENMYDYCQIVDPQCEHVGGPESEKCSFKSTADSVITYRGNSDNIYEQNEYYIFTSLQNITHKVNNLVYNIYDYVQESSHGDTGLDTGMDTSSTPLDDKISEYCKTSCQRIVPDTTNYKDEAGNPLSPNLPDVPLPIFNLSKTKYDTYNNNELTYINYTKGQCLRNKMELPSEPPMSEAQAKQMCLGKNSTQCDRSSICEFINPSIDEHNLNNYKNYDVSENIFTNIYSYNPDNCKEIDRCDVDNIKVFDVQHSDTPQDPITIKKLEYFDRVWPKTANIAATDGGSLDYDHKDIYKCSRYCAINETCESIPDDGLLNDSRFKDDTDPNDYKNDDSDPLGRANPKFDNIFSQTNMANINPGYCPPFTKSGADGKCVYYTDGKVYKYNGEEEDVFIPYTENLFGDKLDILIPTVSDVCHLQPKTFQDNIELFHACEEWYLQPTNEPDKYDQTNLDKCMSDLSQNGNPINSKKYSIPDLNLSLEDTPDIVFKNRNTINERFANSYELPSCKINDDSEFNGQTCANFVTDYIVRENYYIVNSEDNSEGNNGLDKLNEYHIGPRSHNGKYVENNPIHNSKIGINPPSPLEPHLGDSYVAKDFIGKYEYAKYVNPNDIFDQTDGSATYDDLNKYKTEKLDPMYEQPGNSPATDSLYSNINRYINGGECATTDGTTNNWPFLGFPPTATVPTDDDGS